MNEVFLGLGSNMNDRFELLKQAVESLRSIGGIEITVISPIYETEPVGGPEQGDYLNAVVMIKTSNSPEDLLDTCLSIEKNVGRIRGERWGPRLIDIDILFYGSEIISTENLRIPHERVTERAFVLFPLADLAPDMIHPISGESIRTLRDKVGGKGLTKRLDLILT